MRGPRPLHKSGSSKASLGAGADARADAGAGARAAPYTRMHADMLFYKPSPAARENKFAQYFCDSLPLDAAKTLGLLGRSAHRIQCPKMDMWAC